VLKKASTAVVQATYTNEEFFISEVVAADKVIR
jgi:hypothetical protein